MTQSTILSVIAAPTLICLTVPRLSSSIICLGFAFIHCKNCRVEYVASVCTSHTVCVSITLTVTVVLCVCVPQCVCDVHTFATYSTRQFLQCYDNNIIIIKFCSAL